MYCVFFVEEIQAFTGVFDNSFLNAYFRAFA